MKCRIERIEELLNELKQLEDRGKQYIRKLEILLNDVELKEPQEIEVVMLRNLRVIKEKTSIRKIIFRNDQVVLDYKYYLDGLDFLLTVSKVRGLYEVIQKSLIEKEVELEFLKKDVEFALELLEK